MYIKEENSKVSTINLEKIKKKKKNHLWFFLEF